MVWYLDFATGRPTPSECHRVCEGSLETVTSGTLFSHLHHNTVSTLKTTMETPVFPSRVVISSRNKPRDSTEGESIFRQHHCDRRSNRKRTPVASSVDSALPLGVVETVGSFGLLVFFFARSEFFLLTVWRDAPLDTKIKIFMFAI